MEKTAGLHPYHLVVECHAQRTRWYPTDEQAAKVGERWARWVNRHIELQPWSIAGRVMREKGGLPWAAYRDSVNDVGSLQMYVKPCVKVGGNN